MNKKIAMGIGVGLCALTLAACGGGSTGEYTIFLYQEGVVYDSSMPVFEAANEYANITLSGILQKSDTSYDTIYQLRGKTASLVTYDQDTIEATALREGQFADLTDLIEDYAPNLKAYFDANPEQKAWATASDGAIYGIPFYTDGSTAKGWFLRLDWIKTLEANNLLPEGVTSSEESLNNLTVDQYEEILRAFKNNASLLGASTIYPYFDRDSDYAISELASLWGGTADYYVDDSGTVRYGLIEDEFREALNHIIEWYSDGLIDPEIIIDSTEDKRVTYFAQNSGGSTHDWIGTTYTFNSDVYASNLVDDFEVICILPPIREDGTRVEPTMRKLIGNVTAINADLDLEDQIKLITWIDFFFSEEGQMLSNFGVEGVDYTVDSNGNFEAYTDTIINDNNTPLANLYSVGAQLQSPGIQNFEYEEAWLSEDAASAMEAYTPYLNTGYNSLIYPNIKLDSSTYNSVNSCRSAIQTLYVTYIAKWLSTGSSISDAEWQAWVEAVNRAGAQTVITAIQAAYDAKTS